MGEYEKNNTTGPIDKLLGLHEAEVKDRDGNAGRGAGWTQEEAERNAMGHLQRADPSDSRYEGVSKSDNSSSGSSWWGSSNNSSSNSSDSSGSSDSDDSDSDSSNSSSSSSGSYGGGGDYSNGGSGGGRSSSEDGSGAAGCGCLVGLAILAAIYLGPIKGCYNKIMTPEHEETPIAEVYEDLENKIKQLEQSLKENNNPSLEQRVEEDNNPPRNEEQTQDFPQSPEPEYELEKQDPPVLEHPSLMSPQEVEPKVNDIPEYAMPPQRYVPEVEPQKRGYEVSQERRDKNERLASLVGWVKKNKTEVSDEEKFYPVEKNCYNIRDKSWILTENSFTHRPVLFYSQDRGKNWTVEWRGDKDNPAYKVVFDDEKTGRIFTRNSIFDTDDGGKTWSEGTAQQVIEREIFSIRGINIDDDKRWFMYMDNNNEYNYRGKIKTPVYISHDRGKNWTPFSSNDE